MLCELCSRMIPIEKYSQHIDYLCKNSTAECPHCFDSYPNNLIAKHIDVCKLRPESSSESEYDSESEENEEDDMYTCNICKAKLKLIEAADHNLAHRV